MALVVLPLLVAPVQVAQLVPYRRVIAAQRRGLDHVVAWRHTPVWGSRLRVPAACTAGSFIITLLGLVATG